MDRMASALSLLWRGRNVVVWSDDGVMQGKAYCKENEVGGYISEMMHLSKGNIRISIERC